MITLPHDTCSGVALCACPRIMSLEYTILPSTCALWLVPEIWGAWKSCIDPANVFFCWWDANPVVQMTEVRVGPSERTFIPDAIVYTTLWHRLKSVVRMYICWEWENAYNSIHRKRIHSAPCHKYLCHDICDQQECTLFHHNIQQHEQNDGPDFPQKLDAHHC